MTDLVVGISGEMYSGKTTAARFLERQGFAYTRISQVIDDVLRERGEKITRENQQRVGLELHERNGQAWLCRRAIERLEGNPKKIVVDGLRWPHDALFFRERYGRAFVHLDIFAPEEMRRTRSAAVGKAALFENAKHHPVESGVAAVGDLANIVILNDSDIPTFERRLAAEIRGGTRAN